MYRLPNLSRRARWAVPGGALVVVGAVMAGALITTAQASPALPPRTPAQLLAAVAARSGPPPALTGTVVESAALGLPQLPGMDDPTSVASLLAGSHTVRIWYANASHFRLAAPGSMSESDLVVSGRTAWLWRSTSNSVTRIVAPADSHESPAEAMPSQVTLTPQQAARQALAAVGPTTTVTVQSNVIVAGEAAYQLVLAPKSQRSLIGQVRIAIDATHNVPLRVQVFARHAVSPGFQVGFTSVSFVRPDPANFRFTPPPGVKVKTVTLPGPRSSVYQRAQAQASADAPTVIGDGWLAVAVLPAADIGGLVGSPSQAAAGAASSAARATAGQAPPGGGESAMALAGVLAKWATPVRGDWGSGRLLRTPLVSMLITNDGRVLIGSVTPSVLFADAAHAPSAAPGSGARSR